jgi:sulfofructosephosphate aldolase
MTPDERRRLLTALARPGGGFAMVANDGRESFRGMLKRAGKATDDVALSQFKVLIARHLCDACSAMLVDLDHGLPALAELSDCAPRAGRIVAVDLLHGPRFGPQTSTSLDVEALRPGALPPHVHALKFLMFWHPDQPMSRRRDQASEFVERCATLGLLSVLEGVVQLPGTDQRFDESLLRAAEEFGQARPDLYKTQVPTLGSAALDEVERLSISLTRAVRVPWVALSNGVAADRFADVVGAVCRGGASGFLAGRASWSAAVDADDPAAELANTGRSRLAAFAQRVDAEGVPWWVAAGLPAPEPHDPEPGPSGIDPAR